jgi:hypothetical protein
LDLPELLPKSCFLQSPPVYAENEMGIYIGAACVTYTRERKKGEETSPVHMAQPIIFVRAGFPRPNKAIFEGVLHAGAAAPHTMKMGAATHRPEGRC